MREKVLAADKQFSLSLSLSCLPILEIIVLKVGAAVDFGLTCGNSTVLKVEIFLSFKFQMVPTSNEFI